MRVTSIVSSLLLGVTAVTAAPAAAIPNADSILEARGLDVVYSFPAPAQEVCPATNNGPGRNYAAHTYTNGQLTAAFREAATLQAKGKQVGVGKYPHAFNNNEKLEFPCGAQKSEFPIQDDGVTYGGGDTNNLPDRIVYEWNTNKKGVLQVKFCGVMRHGPVGGKFISCHS